MTSFIEDNKQVYNVEMTSFIEDNKQVYNV